MDVKVGGGGVEVAVGLGRTAACAPPSGVEVAEAAGGAEGEGGRGVGATLVAGAGCALQALKRMSDREIEKMRAFMGAIIAEAASRVKRTPLFDRRSPLC